MHPASSTNRTQPPALPKKSASVTQMTGMMGSRRTSPSRNPNQRAQPGIPMPAGLRGPQMPGERDPNFQWKNQQPGFHPQNVSSPLCTFDRGKGLFQFLFEKEFSLLN